MNTRLIITIVTLALACIATARASGWLARLRGTKTYSVEDRLRTYEEPVRKRLEPALRQAGLAYPPPELALLVFKQERRLEVHARNQGAWKLIKCYPILAASGKTGPKLMQGDRQVPEGLYQVESLNPNSRYHLSLRVNYPNDFDKSMARKDGRTILGGDIMIHGSDVSIGCVAIGNPAIEEVFVLAARASSPVIPILMAPCDLRTTPAPAAHPPWMADVYKSLRKALADF